MRVFLNVNTIGQLDGGPRFAWFEVTPRYLAHIRELRDLVRRYRLFSATQMDVLSWQGEPHKRVTRQVLVVLNDRFYFAGYPDMVHPMGRLETQSMDVDELDMLFWIAKTDGRDWIAYGMGEDEIGDLLQCGLVPGSMPCVELEAAREA